MKSEADARTHLAGTGLPLRGDDIDTDRIIPARYLKCLTFDELGQYAFYDERFDSEGRKQDHPFNDPRFQGASILLVNKNFGCGSSREHAPQALMRSGTRAIVGESFAEIFAGNCTALGIPAVRVSSEQIEELLRLAERQPATVFSLDLGDQMLKAADIAAACSMPDADLKSLLEGTWDTTRVLLEAKHAILSGALGIPYLNGFQDR